MLPAIAEYHARQTPAHRAVCDTLAREIERGLPEAVAKVWHAHPVWFLGDNPIVGYSAQKPGIRLMFWSGADFDEPGLNVVGKKFKDASVFFNDAKEIPRKDLQRWLEKSREIQWDYGNLVKRKGRLERVATTSTTKTAKPAAAKPKTTKVPQVATTSTSPKAPATRTTKVPKTAAPGLLAGLGAPARRALESAGLVTAAQLARRTEAEILALHGVGPSALPRLRAALAAEGRAFRAGR